MKFIVFLTLLHLGYNTVLKNILQTYLQEEFQKYLTKYQHKMIDTSFCVYINVDRKCLSDIYDKFIKQNSCPRLVLGKTVKNIQFVYKSQEVFIFINEISEIGSVVETLKNYRFWNPRCNHHFIICSPVNNTNFLQNMLYLIWSNNILNFVVVFVFQFLLQIYSLNPFKKEILNFTGDSTNIFSDKLTNLYGHQFDVPFTEDFPLVNRGRTDYQGQDYCSWEVVKNALNATFKLKAKKNFPEILAQIQNKSDFSLNTVFVVLDEKSQPVEYTYPHRRKDFVVMIPIDYDPHRHAMVSIFNPSIWILFLVALVATAAVSTTAEQNKHLFIKFLLKNLESFLGSPFHRLDLLRWQLKLKLIVFIICCMVFRTLFQSFLIGNFISPPLLHPIETVTDLKNSGLKILTSGNKVNITTIGEDDLRSQVIQSTRVEQMRRIRDVDKSVAYLISRHNAEGIVDKRSIGTPEFYIMPQTLTPGIGTYVFRKHSPFLDKIDLYLQRVREFDLTGENFGHTSKAHGLRQENILVALGLQHLELVFIGLFWGLFLSVLTFIAEIISKQLFDHEK
ncbi:hypothetical protein Zmor_007462 [Zophobas morio]|uniref:Ionotropic receptor n=1 Tax=Zophobas morio TaxID=2755281 RepID=A0AA38MNK8_9CUCU|nr:hypothetical protein Zmor_007462 [Zophobas morio]